MNEGSAFKSVLSARQSKRSPEPGYGQVAAQTPYKEQVPAPVEWGQVFGDEVLATAILDRLLHHCEVVPINGPSYRLKNRLQAIERETDVA